MEDENNIMTDPTHEDTSVLTSDQDARNQPEGRTDFSSSTQISSFRSAIINQLNKWAGAVEGSFLFSEFMPEDTLTDQRKAAGKAGIVFTTCIAFQQRILTEAAKRLPDLTIQTNIIGTLAESRAKNIPGAWQEGSAGMTKRPEPGDIYLLTSSTNPAMFSHIGYIRSITVNGDGTETWTTVDGGQGTAGKYDTEGNVTQAGQEKITEFQRTYDPSTNLFNDAAGQHGQLHALKGWVNIDKLANAGEDHAI